MPTKQQAVPKTLSVYQFHGVDVDHTPNAHGECLAECVFCGSDKFSVNADSGAAMCWRCCKPKQGWNATTFIRKLWEESGADPAALEELAADRGLLSTDTLTAWGVRQSLITREWLVPGYGADGHLNQLYKYIRLSGGNKRVLVPTPTLNHQLFGPNVYEPTKPTVYFCYSSDTEVLTKDGWRLFRDLEDSDEIAAYNTENGSVVFELPKERQEFKYDGEMLYFKSEWCELLVTPDHRMAYRYATGSPKWKVKKAHELGGQVIFPTTGISTNGQGTITEIEVRLLAAFVADGCIRKGYPLEFRFRKDRKKKRLKYLLDKAKIPYKIAQYPADRSGGWESIMVDRRTAPLFLSQCPNKTWTGEELNWPLSIRRAMLDELQFWDGDKGKNNIRYYTSKPKEADIVSRIAAVSGYSCQVRTIDRKGLDYDDLFIVSLQDKTERRIHNKARRVPYRGKVYCATVSTGFLVVRRLGKTTVSGNCESYWNALCLWELLGQVKRQGERLVPTGNPAASLLAEANVLAAPGAKTFHDSWAPLFADKVTYLLYDSDHPRLACPQCKKTYSTATHEACPTCGARGSGEPIPPAGWAGAQHAAEVLAAASEPPRELHVLTWGPNGHAPELPSGYDIRDLLTEE